MFHVSIWRGRLPLRPQSCTSASRCHTQPRKYTTASKPTPPSQWRVLFFGSDDVSLASLEKLYATRNSLVQRLEVVVTERPPSNIKSGEVARWCIQNKVPIHEWKDVDKLVDGDGFDIGIVASFGKFIPPKIINSFPYNMINMHPSLLPKYRGAAPIMHAIRNNESETGVCIIDLHPTSWDKGHIYSCTKVPISFEDTVLTLTPRLAAVGGEQLIEALCNYEELSANKQPQPELQPRDAHKATAPKLTNFSDFCIEWGTYDNLQIYNNWRSMPTKAHTYFNSQQFKVSKLTMPKEIPRPLKEVEFELMKQRDDVHLPEEVKLLPDEDFGMTEDPEAAGLIVFSKPLKTLFVRCLKGWVAITEVFVPTADKPLTPAEFINNFQVKKFAKPKFETK